MELNKKMNEEVMDIPTSKWFKAAKVYDIPSDGGACVKYADFQIAIFYFSTRDQWFACQNMCPHKQQMVLARGIVGSAAGEPKVACPFHKRTFSLLSGECLNAEEDCIKTYPVKVVGEDIYLDVSSFAAE